MNDLEWGSKIIKFIQTEMIKKNIPLEINEPLFSSGLIDSFDVVQLAVFLEQDHQIDIDETEMVFENFDTVERIIELIKRKK
jgi:methoxymalonate biosynthesis acyl carrier protein